jgi:multisubunit Na+/H+ antiporter MnhC subunit
LERREAARAVEETTPPEPLDAEIESLLLSLEEKPKPEPVRTEEPDSARRRRRERRESRSAGWRHHLRYTVNQFDLFFVLTAVVFAFAVTLLMVSLTNG